MSAGRFKHLANGKQYAVVRAFTDFDRQVHPAGERWIFVQYTFLPYDDGLSLFVRRPDGQQEQIRMQWRDEEQGPVIDALESYVQAVPE